VTINVRPGGIHLTGWQGAAQHMPKGRTTPQARQQTAGGR
jgi:hypothetical protein